MAVIDMPVLTEQATFDRKYTGVAKFPAMKRDLSMVVKKEIFVGQIEKSSETREENCWKALNCLMCMRATRSKKDISLWHIP